MTAIRFPAPLRPGDRIAVTAPSSGVEADMHRRLDLVLGHMRSRGFDVVEGRCLRENARAVSGAPQDRAADLMEFLVRDDVAAVFPPWGGEILIEILPLLDWDAIAASRPKWVSGFSDLSTFTFALTLRTGIATAHGPQLMDLCPGQDDPLTAAVMPTLALDTGATFTQRSSERWQRRFRNFADFPDATFDLTEKTRWGVLGEDRETAFSGRLIGGCLDTIARLAGSSFGDLPAFVARHRDDGVILFLENCELLPFELVRTLWGLRLAGWFDGLAGVLIGRSDAEEPAGPDAYRYRDALKSALGGLPCPVVVDADVGHRQPQMLLINGARADVHYADGAGSVTQTLS